MTRITAGRRSKYNACRTVVDNITFHSAKEAKRYSELTLLEKAGEITELQLQPIFTLYAPSASGEDTVGKYIADFSYREKGTLYVVEDVKSPATRTALYRWKVKHLRLQDGITVREV